MSPATSDKRQETSDKIELARVASRGVFTINFLRREGPSIRLRRAGRLAALGAVIANLLALFVLVATALVLQQRERAARAGLTGEAEAIAAQLQPLQERAAENLEALQGVIEAQRGRFPLAEKLAGLATTVPPRTWIAHLSGDRSKRTLTIEAVYVLDPATPTDLPIKDWINALKAEARFGDGLKSLEMASSSRAAQGRAELMRFTLDAAWEPSRAGAL